MSFLNNFTLAHMSPELSNRPYYPDFVHDQLTIADTTVININATHFKAYEETKELYNHLCVYPMEIVPLMDRLMAEWVINTMDDIQQSMAAQIKV
jgi:DNA replicative helicase MCM subunit Mcm2 (Cdc46/Mcm family)